MLNIFISKLLFRCSEPSDSHWIYSEFIVSIIYYYHYVCSAWSVVCRVWFRFEKEFRMHQYRTKVKKSCLIQIVYIIIIIFIYWSDCFKWQQNCDAYIRENYYFVIDVSKCNFKYMLFIRVTAGSSICLNFEFTKLFTCLMFGHNANDSCG